MLHLSFGTSPSSQTTLRPRLSAFLSRALQGISRAKHPASGADRGPSAYLQTLVGKEECGCVADQELCLQDTLRDQYLALTAPCASTGNGGTHLPCYVHCFLDAGVQGLWEQSQLEKGNGAGHRITEAKENGCLPWQSHAPAMKQSHPKSGWGGAASREP